MNRRLTIQNIQSLLNHTDPAVREQAFELLAALNDPDLFDSLIAGAALGTTRLTLPPWMTEARWFLSVSTFFALIASAAEAGWTLPGSFVDELLEEVAVLPGGNLQLPRVARSFGARNEAINAIVALIAAAPPRSRPATRLRETLTHLSFSGRVVRLRGLHHLPNLQTLTLNGCQQLLGEPPPRLETLVLRRASLLQNTSLQNTSLQDTPSWIAEQVAHVHLEDALPDARQLQHLNVPQLTIRFSGEISRWDRGVHFEGLHRLETLSVDGPGDSLLDISAFPPLPRLRQLSVSGVRTIWGFSQLHQLPNLRSLRLARMSGLRVLRPIPPRLQRLVLEDLPAMSGVIKISPSSELTALEMRLVRAHTLIFLNHPSLRAVTLHNNPALREVVGLPPRDRDGDLEMCALPSGAAELLRMVSEAQSHPGLQTLQVRFCPSLRQIRFSGACAPTSAPPPLLPEAVYNGARVWRRRVLDALRDLSGQVRLMNEMPRLEQWAATPMPLVIPEGLAAAPLAVQQWLIGLGGLKVCWRQGSLGAEGRIDVPDLEEIGRYRGSRLLPLVRTTRRTLYVRLSADRAVVLVGVPRPGLHSHPLAIRLVALTLPVPDVFDRLCSCCGLSGWEERFHSDNPSQKDGEAFQRRFARIFPDAQDKMFSNMT